MKTTMMSLCAVAVLAGSAYAQQANPVPPAENPPVAAPENPTPVPPAPPIEEVKKEKPPVNTDVSEAKEPLEEKVAPLPPVEPTERQQSSERTVDDPLNSEIPPAPPQR